MDKKHIMDLDASEQELELRLQEELAKIQPLDHAAVKACQKRWDSIAKPLHSLGKLEDNIAQIAGIIGSTDVKLDKKALVIMCADNGVVAEGVTQTGQEVTAIVAENFKLDNPNMTSAKLMAIRTNTDIFPVDIGVAVPTSIIDRKIAFGTNNIAKGPAMTRQQALLGILTGIELVKDLKEDGYQIICTGEMGIGNTTTSSAVSSVLLDLPIDTMTGRGAGLSAEGMRRKKAVIERAIATNKPDYKDAIDVLTKVGGFDLCGLAGVFLGGAISRVPIVIDGFISGTAALCANRIYNAYVVGHMLKRVVESTSSTTGTAGSRKEVAITAGANSNLANVMDFAMASHSSKEPAGKHVLSALKKTPMLTCSMCLGEGTGAIATLPVLELGLDVYQKMSTFEEINIEEYKPLS